MTSLLTKANKPTSRQSERFPVKSLGVDILIRPMSAARQFQLDLADKFDDDGKSEKPAEYVAAITADSIVDEAGETIFTAAELLAMEWPIMNELTSLVRKFIKGPTELPAKNSTPASDSPSV